MYLTLCPNMNFIQESCKRGLIKRLSFFEFCQRIKRRYLFNNVEILFKLNFILLKGTMNKVG